MKQDAIRQTMIDGAIRVIAKDGLDKATTKLLATEAGVNEVYIYRFYEGKEDLLVKTFKKLDEELLKVLLDAVSRLKNPDKAAEQRCWDVYYEVWRFLLSNKEKCTAFIRYYYSPYFQRYSYPEHMARYKPLLEVIMPFFKKKANVWMILNHILNVMLDFALKIIDGNLEDCEDTDLHVFKLIYESVKQYFK